MRLPGVCIVCRGPVLWNGKWWQDPSGRRREQHVCPMTRAACRAWMPRAKERCARRPGHGLEHRSRWAMDNDRRMRTGRAA